MRPGHGLEASTVRGTATVASRWSRAVFAVMLLTEGRSVQNILEAASAAATPYPALSRRPWPLSMLDGTVHVASSAVHATTPSANSSADDLPSARETSSPATENMFRPPAKPPPAALRRDLGGGDGDTDGAERLRGVETDRRPPGRFGEGLWGRERALLGDRDGERALPFGRGFGAIQCIHFPHPPPPPFSPAMPSPLLYSLRS
mmetsp:Transcript_56400/g.136421  ORF Transcript_56400/g.136421 Transcript_56400/m.136421 type:complete len:204 (+) Transcript_56400:438-1049(+)